MASALLSSRNNSGPSAAAPTARMGAANRNKTTTFCLVLGLIFNPPTRFFCPFQKKIDAAFDVRIAILVKMQLGHMPEAQPGGQFVPEKPRRVLQGRHRLPLLPFVATQCDFYRSVF